MKLFRSFLLLASILLFKHASAQNPSFHWAAAVSSTDAVRVTEVVTDSAGNVYTAGEFSGTADFDPGNGIFTLTALGNSDIYIQKLDASGSFVNAIRIGGSSGDNCYGMCLDATNRIVLTGIYQETADFDGSTATYTISSGTNGLNGYVAKYDFSLGLDWVVNLGTPGLLGPTAKAVATDSAGNCYVTGMFFQVRDFDPGVGTATLDASAGNIFILRLSPSGSFNWVKQVLGYEVVCITTDRAGNVILGGNFNGTSDFDPGTGAFGMTSTGHDGFLLKLDPAGNFIWAKKLGGSGTEHVLAVKTDCNNNVVCGGYFSSSFMADPSSTLATYTSAGDYDAFVVKLDASGNYAWGKKIGSVAVDYCTGIDLDVLGDVYYCGGFSGGNNASAGFACDFDPGTGTYSLASAGYYDAFVSKLSASGNFVWAYRAGGSSDDISASVFLSEQFGVHVGGTFWNTVDFDPFAPVYNLVSTGGYDGFTWKFTQANPVLPVVSINPLTMEICAGKTATLSATGNAPLTWYASSTATLPIASGSVFVTPPLINQTTYYVFGELCGYRSSGIPVTVTVNSLPLIVITASQLTVCPGAVVTLTASGAQTYTWNNITPGNTYTSTVNASVNFTVTGTDAKNCVNSNTVTINVQTCVDLPEGAIRSIAVYPNPCNGTLTLKSEFPCELQLTDLRGRVLQTIIVNTEETKVDLKLEQGMYLLFDKENKNSLVKKILVLP